MRLKIPFSRVYWPRKAAVTESYRLIKLVGKDKISHKSELHRNVIIKS